MPQASQPRPSPQPPSELAALLAQLPPQQRIAAALFYVEDLDVHQVAHAMDLSDGAVKYHLHAARQTLRGALEAVSQRATSTRTSMTERSR